MPELPEVETVRRGLAPLVNGALINEVRLNRPNLRFAFPPDFAKKLTGRRITNVGRRAKYLLFELDSGDTLISHLGMTGNFRFDRMEIAQPTRLNETGTGKHDHVVMLLETETGEKLALLYSDPRRFGFMDMFADVAQSPYLRDLGPEPLGNAMTAEHLASRFANRRTPIKSALLDQRNIAGLGNIYVCEALWRARIAPQTLAKALVDATGRPGRALEDLTVAIRDVLQEAINAGGSTLKDFKKADGGTGYFQHSFDVYGRQDDPCRREGCGGQVARIVQSGRSSFYCPACQPEMS